MTTTLMTQRGSQLVSFEDVKNVCAPSTSQTYMPIPYADAISYLLAEVERQLGLTPRTQEFALNKEGKKLFARFNYDVGDTKSNLSVGLRGSYDKSMAWKIGGGQSMLICDNMCFSASAFVIMRKNTLYSWRDYKELVASHVAKLPAHYEATKKECKVLEEVPCNQTRGYAILGVALGRKVLTPTQASAAYGDWDKPRYADFENRTLWSLYNCVTEGLKKGDASGTINRYANAHAFFQEMATRKPIIETTCSPA